MLLAAAGVAAPASSTVAAAEMAPTEVRGERADGGRPGGGAGRDSVDDAAETDWWCMHADDDAGALLAALACARCPRSITNRWRAPELEGRILEELSVLWFRDRGSLEDVSFGTNARAKGARPALAESMGVERSEKSAARTF